MRNKLLNFDTVPRWVIQLIDLVLISWSFALSYFTLKHFEFSAIYRGHFFVYTGIYCLISITVFYFMKIHTGLIRYSNTQDIFRIFSAVLISSIIYPIALKLLILVGFNITTLNIVRVLLINFFITSSLLIMLRTAVKEIFHYGKRIATRNKERVIIFGSDSSAILVKQALESSKSDSYIIQGFLDINSKKVNTYIEQKRVYGIKEISQLKAKNQIDKLIIVNEELGSKEKKHIIEQCLKIGINIVTVPPSDQWVYGRLSLKQIKNLNIEDLLQREPIVINNHLISNEINGKRILITGAAGSIGSEIVRQVMSYSPGMIILCDQAESALHEMQLEVEEKYPNTDIKIFIGSIQNFKRMQVLFKEYQPEIIFHAAAYKHVPMMEKYPVESVLTNVMGTKNIADLAVLFDAEKFVMISTDKAVNPTNVMGTSKRIAEMYIQSLSNSSENIFDLINLDYNKLQPFSKVARTKFVTTRFGNVLDSSGSVIPRFRSQIEKGGPITVTHPDITRYFMTIPEAVHLVLEAGIMGKGGEIFVFDMGKPVKIANLALQMIHLAGLVPETDIKIIYTGLRPGEKLYEELLNENEKTLPTHHEKIKIAKVITYPFEQVQSDIEELLLISNHDDNYRLVKKMKDMVPEFISNNSQFECLDHVQEDELVYEENQSVNKKLVNHNDVNAFAIN
jgi:FlaA1/EpsC-like NDP-sugar epimerase